MFLVIAGASNPSPDLSSGEYEALRQAAIAAARTAWQHERDVARLEREVALLDREVAGGERGLRESRDEQERLLGALERLARNPPSAFVLAPEGPVDRVRTGMLMAAAVPALGAEAQALTGEIGRLAGVRSNLARKREELELHRAALARNHELIAQTVARRAELAGAAGRASPEFEAKIRGFAEPSANIGELIKRADAEFDRRDKESKGKSGAADPSRPRSPRNFKPEPGSLLPPVSSEVGRRFGQADLSGTSNDGLTFAARIGDLVVAPFEGTVIYAAPFGHYGLVLIVRHGGGYHSVLAGLGRVNAGLGQSVLAGEPIGTMPDAQATGSGTGLLFELYRDGKPLDPLPLLADKGAQAKRVPDAAENRVRE